METRKLLLSLFLAFASINVFAQYSPDGIDAPGDSGDDGLDDPVIGVVSDSWRTKGNEITDLYGCSLGTLNAYPIHIKTNGINRMIVDTLGNVGIGTENPKAKLAVNGSILAKGVKINTTSAYWPDYVFSPEYELMSLKELENYISENKHLPGIISADEVEKQGNVDLGEMNAKLLEKIEELTLYIIDLQKQIERQQTEIDKLKTK